MLHANICRAENVDAQRVERMLASDAGKQDSVTAENRRPTEAQRDAAVMEHRDSMSKIIVWQLSNLVLPAKRDVCWNEFCLNRIQHPPGCFNRTAQVARHEQA